MRDLNDILPMVLSFSMVRNNESFSALFIVMFGFILKCGIENFKQIQKFFEYIWVSKKCFTVSARISYLEGTVNMVNVPKKFNAIQYCLMNTITKDKTTKLSYSVDNIYTYTNDNLQFVTFNSKHAKYSIAPSICLSQEISETSSDKDGSLFVKYTIHLWSLKNNFKEVVEFIKMCEKQYQESLQKITPTIYILSEMDKNIPYFESIPFKSSKTFDNMFFPQKEDLKYHLDFFKNNKAHYDRLGIPYTLGMMFHGCPGCGKTSATKAIANYTGRHLIIVPVDKITTANQLKSLFTVEDINQTHIPMDQRLYCFEEIDCGKWKDIVRSRKLPPLQSSKDTDSQQMQEEMMIVVPEQPTNYKKRKGNNAGAGIASNEPSITLGDLLEILDGIVETPGRMIIMTSNHPETIDEALLRPGRVDINIEFKKMLRKDIKSMYELWFKEPMPDIVYNKIRDYVFTQADIGNMFNLASRKTIHSKLMSSTI